MQYFLNSSVVRRSLPLTQMHHRAMSKLASSYAEMVQKGSISSDPHQMKIVKLMDKLCGVTETFDFESLQNNASQNQHQSSRLRGIYLFGNVGTGKTLLMDLLYRNCSLRRKRKVHFHQFMLEVHRRIHQHKQYLLQKYGRQRHINLSEEQDSIKFVAREISKEAHLLCFDEFQVTDICDAVIMTRLFDTLWSQGVVLVATSNRPPDDLYLNGMNRRDFLPFINRMKHECIVRELDGGQDYRVLRHKGSWQESSANQNLYLHPICGENRDRFFSAYQEEVERLKSEAISLRDVVVSKDSNNHVLVPIPHSNRFITMDMAEPAYGIGLMSFKSICETDRGASDFHALASSFHTIFLASIPKLTKEKHNSSRRFITLIDELYNANIRLICLADGLPHELFTSAQDEIIGDVNLQENHSSQLFDSVETSDDMKKYGRNYAPGMSALLTESQKTSIDSLLVVI